jgi:gliding motility-associated-like protein
VIFTNTSEREEQTKFQWFFHSNNGFTSNAQNTSYLYLKEGVYPVVMIVSNKWNCSDTAMKIITVAPDFNIYIPNAFTPNDDDRNDIFLPIVQSEKLYTLSIFDRWGQRVFISKDSRTGWDGTFKGEECKTDVYTYKITLSTAGGSAKEYSGSVSLIR